MVHATRLASPEFSNSSDFHGRRPDVNLPQTQHHLVTGLAMGISQGHRPKILFVDMGGTPYSAICAHLFSLMTDDYVVLGSAAVGKARRPLMARLRTSFNLRRGGLPWRKLMARVPFRHTLLAQADIVLAIDHRTKDQLQTLALDPSKRLVCVTDWPVYRMPTYSAEATEAALSDLESRLRRALDTGL
jgi:protein-tyrosine-phosphatase